MTKSAPTAARLVAERRSLLWDEAQGLLYALDQTVLPHEEKVLRLARWEEAASAIGSMQVRGAPLIGITAAYALALAARTGADLHAIEDAAAALRATRPTAVNLAWAVERVLAACRAASASALSSAALAEARAIERDETDRSRRIGDHGAALLSARARRPGPSGAVLRVLTHCNTGWLATVGPGTALAVVYALHEGGAPLHVWTCETRPRSQGARLTAWELARAGVPCTLVADTAAGHLLQRGLVDVCLVGCDRATARGDVCNKIGTYPLALAARDNEIPLYAALPASSVDWEREDATGIPIEERDPSEVTAVDGRTDGGTMARVHLAPAAVPAANYAFDVTPARLVSGLVTEHGVFPASPQGLARLRALAAPGALR